MNIKITTPMENFEDIDFGDVRIKKRTVQVTEDLTKKTQESLNSASGSRGNAKAAYRLLSNEKFSVTKLMDAAQKKTIEAIGELPIVLLVQDTTDVNYNTHKKTEGLGYSSEKVLGVKVHSCIALSGNGVPIGLMFQETSTRDKAKVEMKGSDKSKRPITEKESNRWLETMRKTTSIIPKNTQSITICDRECDFYEFYNEAINIQEKFVVRVVNNRVTSDSERLRTTLEKSEILGTAELNIPRDTRNNRLPRTAILSISYVTISINKPKIREETNILPQITFNAIRVFETNPPEGIESIEWILATNLDIKSAEQAFTIVGYYVERWKIERFHYVLKSGCKVEEIQQRSFEKIKPMMLIYSVISIFILAMTLASREIPGILCNSFFDETEWKLLFRAANKTQIPPTEPYLLSDAIKYLGILAGRKLAPSDGFIGAETIWKGWFALQIIVEFAPFVGQV